MTTDQDQVGLSKLPGIDAMLSSPDVAPLLDRYPRALVTEACRTAVARHRAALRARARRDGQRTDVQEAAERDDGLFHIEAAEVEEDCRRLVEGSLRRVINGTGVVVHTNLGRSPLPQSALDRIAELAGGYSSLEYDLEAGKRGSRHDHAAAKIRRLLGAEDALVVNNNAAAVLVSLAALARDKEVVVSRGELIEIGGSFRIPDVMEQSGARLVEVGTTNRTHAKDYERATGEDTALLLKVHQSNFAIVGFTKEVEASELVALGKRLGVWTMMDLGSGCVQSAYAAYPSGPFPEPGADQMIKMGIDLITFSGDKLLGGPQAGIIAGKAELVARIRNHPLVRAVRPGKLTLAALDAVLERYLWNAGRGVPTADMICEPADSVAQRAEAFLKRFRAADVHAGITCSLIRLESRVGGGALPSMAVPSAGIAITSSTMPAVRIEEAMRRSRPPVVGRIVQDRFVVDMRTVSNRDQDDLIHAVAMLAKA